MKLIYQNIRILLAVCLLIVAGACEEDLEKALIKGEVEANVLTALGSSDYVFTFETKDEVFNVFSWTAPDFGFEAVINYTVQMDTAGGGFTNPVNLVTTQNLTISPTVSVVNAALLGMGLAADVAAEVQFRVRSSVSTHVDPVYSNVVSANITPYLAVFPPIYIIGDAQGWDLGRALEMTSTGPGTYEAIGLFQEAGKFRFFATPSWDAEQWRFSFFEGGSIPSELIDGADNDSNFLFDGATGVYKITVNLNNQTITLEEGELPTLFVIGEGQGWDLQQAAELTFMGGGLFEGTADLVQDATFRFFEKADWGATQYGYSHFAGGTIPAECTDSEDNDSNFLFTGATGTYDITVDINNKIITLEAASEFPAALYIVGDGQGWTFANAVAFTNLGGGNYEAEADFSLDDTFRFFEEVDNWNDAYGYSYFAEGTVDDDLGDNADSDSNFKFLGETGFYKITVSLSEMTITVEPSSPYPDNLYLVGDNQSWTFANSPAFTNMGDGVYQATGATFTNGSTFRFFEELDNWNDAFAHAYFTGSVDADLEAAGDGDDNFRFIGSDGSYNVTVDLQNKTIDLTQ